MRIKVLGTIIFSAFLFLITGLFYIQIIRGANYQRLATRNRIRLVPIESPRGRIFDRNGLLLVYNRMSFDVSIITQEVKNKEELLGKLSVRLGTPKEKLASLLKKNFVTPFQPVKIASDIGKIRAISLEEERLDLPGVLIETTPRRHYSYGVMGSHIFGYLGRINPRELEKLKTYGYVMTDFVGRAGIEQSYDTYLKGTHGGMQVEVDAGGHQMGMLGIKEPVKGKDLYLTIDMRVQETMEKIFEGGRGAACVMDTRNGQVLGLVSTPSFDPNVFMAEENSGQIASLLTSGDYPLLNRTIQCDYPPGSVFKVVTASAGLDRGRVTPDKTFYCSGLFFLGGHIFRCWKEDGHGAVNTQAALKYSCNVYFYQLGRLIGGEDMANYSMKYGFGQPTGIDIPGEISGLVPNRMWKLVTKREPWYEGETINFAIGQGYLKVTPIQLVRMMAAVANGGYLVQPHLVRRIEQVEIAQEKKVPVGVPKEIIDLIKGGLVMVVNAPDGTGKRAAIPGVTVAGKTGTAQTGTDKTHAWFSGFAPAEDPKYALVVLLEFGGKGGLRATQAAHDILLQLKNLGYI